MAKLQNITITVDAETAQWARVYAAQHGTSVSKIVGELLRERHLRELGYERSMKSFFSRGPRPLSDEPAPYPTREALHER